MTSGQRSDFVALTGNGLFIEAGVDLKAAAEIRLSADTHAGRVALAKTGAAPAHQAAEGVPAALVALADFLAKLDRGYGDLL